MRGFIRRAYIAVACALAIGIAGIGGSLYAQQGFTTISNLIVLGHFFNGGSGTAAVPVGSSCTIVSGSSDTDGSCATTGASGSITFAVAYATAPFCSVVDATATSTVSMPVYTVSTTVITLSTIITAHTLFWHCAARVGG